MPEEPLADTMGKLLQDAIVQAEALQARMEAGEEIDEEEITMLARLLATQMEEARSMLESVCGPVDPEELKANLKATLSPEEYQEWLEGEEERLKFRAEYAAEKPIREQLQEPQ